MKNSLKNTGGDQMSIHTANLYSFSLSRAAKCKWISSIPISATSLNWKNAKHPLGGKSWSLIKGLEIYGSDMEGYVTCQGSITCLLFLTRKLIVLNLMAALLGYGEETNKIKRSLSPTLLDVDYGQKET